MWTAEEVWTNLQFLYVRTHIQTRPIAKTRSCINFISPEGINEQDNRLPLQPESMQKAQTTTGCHFEFCNAKSTSGSLANICRNAKFGEDTALYRPSYYSIWSFNTPDLTLNFGHDLPKVNSFFCLCFWASVLNFMKIELIPLRDHIERNERTNERTNQPTQTPMITTRHGVGNKQTNSFKYKQKINTRKIKYN